MNTTAAQRKSWIGKRIRFSYKSDYDPNRGICYPAYRYATIVDVKWFNLFTDEGNALWSKDLMDIEVIEENP